MPKIFIVICLLFFTYNAQSQIIQDTGSLQNVTVTAFASQAKWKDVPAAVALISKQQLQLLNNTSLVPVLNSIPGVRMEERSPGSYRFSIRGSLLRSPFGVRNVKVYWNDIPLTDAGGNTYLQSVSITQVNSLEIIKGPASSLYGANTGGAIVLHTDENFTKKQNIINIGVEGGSFGMFNQQAGYKFSSSNLTTSFMQSHQQNDGYRQQSALRRDAFKWDGKWQLTSHESLRWVGLYSNLHYQTPGGISQLQMQTNPKLARQPTATLPGAVQQNAGVYNNTFFGGLSLTSVFTNAFSNITTLFGSHTNFKNPFITNYEKRNEKNYGGRTIFFYNLTNTSKLNVKWLLGAEWQQNHSFINDYGNKRGVADTVQSLNELYATQYFYFTQFNLQLNNKLTVQTGISLNKQLFSYRSFMASPSTKPFDKRNAGNQWAPRLSVLYNLSNNVGWYTIASKGFSSPTLAEIFPSSQNYDAGLQAEYGWNFETGFKGTLFKNFLLFDASVYYFKLQHAIVRRTDSTGAEYFVNAGGTSQKGAELWLKANIVSCDCAFINHLSLANSFTYQPYTFSNYISSGNNYSGNKLTGVPRTANVITVEAATKAHMYANIIYNYTSSLPLNDANTVFAKAYHLLQAKIGYQRSIKKMQYNIYTGFDNILNQLYSLGNDLNAAGGRYFNPAPKRNVYAGIQLNF